MVLCQPLDHFYRRQQKSEMMKKAQVLLSSKCEKELTTDRKSDEIKNDLFICASERTEDFCVILQML